MELNVRYSKEKLTARCQKTVFQALYQRQQIAKMNFEKLLGSQVFTGSHNYCKSVLIFFTVCPSVPSISFSVI